MRLRMIFVENLVDINHVDKFFVKETLREREAGICTEVGEQYLIGIVGPKSINCCC